MEFVTLTRTAANIFTGLKNFSNELIRI
ncbi:uncharacterized protein METZ01_LOCUS4409 [marine metagenome]|uniref:Uncharacterized protein n=1 Tax=marine metagenome TaxID=408172 RepID=A0A381NAJ4_9ZZZZ